MATKYSVNELMQAAGYAQNAGQNAVQKSGSGGSGILTILFVILLLGAVGGAGWYFWNEDKKKKEAAEKEAKKQAETKQQPVNPTETKTNTTATSYIDKNFGGLDAVWKKFETEPFFRNQWLGNDYKEQVALAQIILNDREKSGLLVDGDFGPKTKAAVTKVFGKEKVNLGDIDVKYKLTKIVTGKQENVPEAIKLAYPTWDKV